jgi:glycosyltransferase involved in cell wall biosynthesis
MEKRIVNVASYNRIDSLVRSLESIYNQCDEINVCLNNHNGEIPDILYRDKVNLFFTDNSKGDAFKFLMLEESNGYFLTIDDDLIYPEGYVDYMVNKCIEHGNKKIITLHGRSFSLFPINSYYKSASERYACLENVKNDVIVQFGGTGVMCFHTSLLKVSIDNFLYPNMADIWIGKFAKQRNIPILCLQHSKGYIGYIHQNTTIFNEHSTNDRVQTFVVNRLYGIDIKYDISIIIPTFQNVNYIDDCLKSIEAAMKNHMCEILVGIDGCRETLNHLKSSKISPYTSVYYFERNEGPYTIKNTLANIAKSDNLIFFDSDDLMGENMVDYVIKSLDRYVCVKPKMYNFDNETNKPILNLNTHGEGVFAIKKDLFISMNGFEPWMCAADSDFMGRLYKRNPAMIGSPSPLFSRRIHDNSLTTRKETGMRSVMRHQYVKISKNKKGNGNPNILHTRDFILIDDISFFSDFDNFLQSEMMLKKNNAQLSVLSVLTKAPRKVIDKMLPKEKTTIEVDYGAISHLLNKPHPMIPKPKVNNQLPQNKLQPIPQTQKSNSNKETLQKLFLSKRLNKSDSSYMNIGGKINR